MRSDRTVQHKRSAIQEFTDHAITAPDDLAAISRQLRRPARVERTLWIAAVAVALVVGLLLGRVLLP